MQAACREDDENRPLQCSQPARSIELFTVGDDQATLAAFRASGTGLSQQIPEAGVELLVAHAKCDAGDNERPEHGPESGLVDPSYDGQSILPLVNRLRGNGKQCTWEALTTQAYPDDAISNDEVVCPSLIAPARVEVGKEHRSRGPGRRTYPASRQYEMIHEARDRLSVLKLLGTRRHL